MRRRHARGAALALMLGLGGGLGVGGCSAEYGSLSIYKVDGESGSVADRNRIRLRQGEVLVFEADIDAADPDRPYQGFEKIEMGASDRGVAEVRPVVLVDTWMVIGQAPGTTQMLVEVDGDVVESIPIEVEE